LTRRQKFVHSGFVADERLLTYDFGMIIKPIAKKLLGESNYIALRNIRYSKTVGFLNIASSFPKEIVQQRLNFPYFAFDFRSKIGMGAMLTHITLLLAYAEEKGLIPVCRISNPHFADGSDAFDTFLVAKRPPEPGRKIFFHYVRTPDYTRFKPRVEPRLNEMNRIFFKYFDFNERVYQIANCVTAGCVPPGPRIGIHYRGTDKVFEAPNVSYEAVFEAVDHYCNEISVSQIFLATDSNGFAEAIKTRFPHINFISYCSGALVNSEVPRHFSSLSGEDKAVEAVVNIILLARCDICIRTASQLSAWSRILNKDLKTVTLNRTYYEEKYPEMQVWEESLRPVLGKSV
jgi:Nodulation protein Z (NodZ)